MSIISSRRLYTEKKTEDLRKNLMSSEEILNGKACVYATGSFGRLEASEASDLDLFIVGLNGELDDETGQSKSALSNLDAILVKAGLIGA